MRKRAGWTPIPLVAAVLLLATSGAAHTSPVMAADDGGSPQQHVRTPRTVNISPRIGPPGTEVSLTSNRMPAITPVQLALGATTGFEALIFARTSIDGELEASVTVPSWSENDETQRFIVFNVYFTSVLAESVIFHVTDEDGGVVREGTIGLIGTDCLVLDGDDGERYRLTGTFDRLEVGNRHTLSGTLTESLETCGDQLSLALELSASE